MVIITVDGNIGSGKTTSLEYLHTRYGCAVDLEPVEKWKSYLKNIYEDKTKNFEFQVRVWIDRCWLQPTHSNTPLIMERSPLMQAEVFVAANKQLKNITYSEYNTLLDMYKGSLLTWQPHLYIYLRSNPEKCAERIRKRNRQSEEHIDVSYLKLLHAYHERAYVQSMALGVRMICIDVEGKTVEEVGDEIHRALGIFGFLPTPAPAPLC
jgi:deoxyadenosine/deoxycytidine kinase